MLPLQWTYLALGLVLASVTLAGARGPPGWEELGFGTASVFTYPAEEEHRITMRLVGTATDASTREGWGVALTVTGSAMRHFSPGPDGAWVSEETGTLYAALVLLDPLRHEPVDKVDGLVDYHAARADAVAGAVEAWHFQLLAPEGQAPLWFALQGDVTGVEAQAGQTYDVLTSGGQAEVASAAPHRASQYRLDLAGQASDERV